MTAALIDLRDRAPRWVRWSAPPTVAWLVASLITWIVARASGVAYWSIGAREHWDSAQYLSISRGGYEMFNCWDRAGYRAAGFPDVICGNVAWFPGYPMVVRAFTATGMSYDVAAIVISELALLGMLSALWWLLGSRLTWSTGLTMAIAVVFPGGIYYHAVFPIALGTLALMVAVIGVKRGSWVIAASAGFVASACHLVGAVVVGMLLLSALYAWKSDPVRIRVAKAAGSATIALGGVVWAKWIMWQATGKWDAYEQINRSSYGQGSLKNPFSEIKVDYTYPFRQLFYKPTHANWLVDRTTSAQQPQLWLNCCLVGVIVLFTAWRLFRDRCLEVEEWAALILVCGIFAMPFFAGAKLSWYRNHAQMFVALVLIKSLPRWAQAVVLVCCAAAYVMLSAMYFGNVLV